MINTLVLILSLILIYLFSMDKDESYVTDPNLFEVPMRDFIYEKDLSDDVINNEMEEMISNNNKYYQENKKDKVKLNSLKRSIDEQRKILLIYLKNNLINLENYNKYDIEFEGLSSIIN